MRYFSSLLGRDCHQQFMAEIGFLKTCRGSPKTAVPGTGAIWPIVCRQTEQPLRARHRELSSRPRPTAVAALLHIGSAKSVQGWLRSHDFGDEGFSRRRNRPFTSQVRKGPLDHLNRPFDKVDGCKLRERLQHRRRTGAPDPLLPVTQVPQSDPALKGRKLRTQS